jgi:hypothetical protein
MERMGSLLLERGGQQACPPRSSPSIVWYKIRSTGKLQRKGTEFTARNASYVKNVLIRVSHIMDLVKVSREVNGCAKHAKIIIAWSAFLGIRLIMCRLI